MKAGVRRNFRAVYFGLSVVVLAGCEAMPALTTLAMSFTQDLIAAAAVNHTPRYATQVESLLLALAAKGTGMQMQPILAQSGYQPPPRQYLPQQQDDAEYLDDTYDVATDTTGYSDDASIDSAYTQVGATEDPYGDTSNADDTYAAATYADDAYAADTYVDSTYVDDTYTDSTETATTSPNEMYAQQTNASGYSVENASAKQTYSKAIELNVALLARRAGQAELTPVEDGAVLRDGGREPASGDLLKVHFQTNCECYVYVIGVDATGYVAQIYPDEQAGQQPLVQAGTSYLVPASDDWWALDEFKGIEQVFFLASRHARADVEGLLREMAGIERSVAPTNFRSVQAPVVLPPVRGLVKVKARPVSVYPAGASQSGRPPQMITPTLFTTSSPTDQIVVSRWFHHE